MGLLDKIKEIFGGKPEAPDAPAEPDAPAAPPPAAPPPPAPPPPPERPEGGFGGGPPQQS
jgi:hypothetical protein